MRFAPIMLAAMMGALSGCGYDEGVAFSGAQLISDMLPPHAIFGQPDSDSPHETSECPCPTPDWMKGQPPVPASPGPRQ